MSTVSGQTGRRFSRLDWALLVVALVLLTPFLIDALTQWYQLLGDLWQL